jgi:hypothetical protein
MDTSARVLRNRVQAILGQLSPEHEKENFHEHSSPPVLRASSVKDIIAIVDSERSRRSVGSAMSLSMRKLDEENEKLRTEIECLNLRIIESEASFSKRNADMTTKHSRQLSSLQAEIASAKTERENLICEFEKLKSENHELSQNLAVKHKRDEERFKSELGRAKAALTAKKKKWEEEKIVEIQQKNAKTIELEIQRLIEAQKIEIKTLNSVHEQQVRELEEAVGLDVLRAEQKAQEEIEMLRQKIETERAAHIETETKGFEDFKCQLDDAKRLFDKELEAECSRFNEKETKLKIVGQEETRKADDRMKALEAEFKIRLHEVAAKAEKESEAAQTGIEQMVQELDRARLEITLLQQRLDVSERDKEIFKESELLILEDKVREVLNEKNQEIDQLVAKVEFLERIREKSYP